MILRQEEKMSLKSNAERRAAYGREPARSVSAPPRKRWFHKASLCRVQSQEMVCDDVTRKLVGAITTWHDIHSNLLRLSIDKSSSDSSLTDDSVMSTDSEEQANEIRARLGNGCDTDSARFSISNPELTSIQIKHMFPELSEHWRYVACSALHSFSHPI
ncbi:unnamed protein product [Heligmosomoides polygyrus]|uniref:Uncharacterized protein n=1 Tax=Heligmosomoides polygyrus TaxID=6339 RepID=A0A183FE97_HELPZ|nr:unnamed protein product [Heligmosomoides polygyrus]